MESIMIQKVTKLNLEELSNLVEQSSAEGFRHLDRLVSDYLNGINRFDQLGEALFAAYDQKQLVGICGVNQDPYLQDKKIGRVRRLFVSPRFRRLGVGRLLMDHVMQLAKQHFQLLVLRTNNPIADKFYRSLGFSNCQDSDQQFSHFLRLTDRGAEHELFYGDSSTK